MTAMQTDDPATTAPDTHAVCVRGLSHTYKPVKQRRSSRRHAPPVQDAALDAVDLDVRPGEIFGLLGPNGSGKSTLLRILATVQAARPTREPTPTITVFGDDVSRQPQRVREHLGVVFQYPSLDLKLTAIENLTTHGKLYGLSGAALHDAATHALGALGLAERMHERTEAFSGGMRRRVEIAKALLTKPRLLLMDEASAGLDLAIQHAIWHDLRALVAETGLTVLLTTHLMDEAERCDRVAVMSAGRVVAVDSPGGLVGRVGGQVLEVTPAQGTSADQLREAIQIQLQGRIDGSDMRCHQQRVHIEHPDAARFIDPLADALDGAAASYRLGRPTLADAYLKLTGQTLGA